MQLLKRIPFFLVGLVLFFCLHGAVENYGFIGAGELVFIGLIILGSLILFYLLIFAFTRRHRFTALVVFFVALWYLFFGAFHDWLKTISFLSFLHGYSVLLPVLIILTIGWIIYLRRHPSIHPRLVLYLNLVLMIYCLVDGIQLLRLSLQTEKKAVSLDQPGFDLSKVQQKPNVYFLLFDEYPGYKTLADSFHFRNDQLYASLAEYEFNVLPTFTNYDLTLFSMSSIFNMDYVDSNYDHRKLTQHDLQQRLQELKDTRVFHIFRSMGYAVNNYSIFDIKGQPRIASRNSLFPVHAPLLTDKILHNRLIRDLAWVLVTGKFQVPAIREKFLYGKDMDNRFIAQKLKEESVRKHDKPQFYYAHFLMPHRPFFRDSSGNLRDFRSSKEMYELFYDRDIFLGYLQYTNTVIRSILKELTENDPGAIIVLMSDHGFHTFNNAQHATPNNYDNICAVRFPDKHYLPAAPRWSTVNFYRYLFNCEYGQQLPYLKDSSIWVNQ